MVCVEGRGVPIWIITDAVKLVEGLLASFEFAESVET